MSPGIVHKILQEAQGNGECKLRVKWRDTIVLTHLARFEKDGYRTESHRQLSDDECIGLDNTG